MAKGGGREPVRRGKAFENLLEMANKLYLQRGLAFVDHYGPKTRTLGRHKGGSLITRIVGKAPPDYVGFLQGGPGVAFEAKSADAKVQTTLTKRLHQFDTLKEIQRVTGTEYFGYLHHWQKRDEGKTTWHPITGLELEMPRKLVLVYEEGIVVPDFPDVPGVPDWLAVIAPEIKDWWM